jgi:hypothetical protein
MGNFLKEGVIICISSIRICKNSSNVISLYIHGGQDIKEGSFGNLWKLNIEKASNIGHEDHASEIFNWEEVPTSKENNPGLLIPKLNFRNYFSS